LCVTLVSLVIYQECVEKFIENLVIMPTLSMLGIYYVQVAALSGNVSNQMCSRKGNIVIFIRRIEGSL
jgi:hypothetical protein